ncbi:hypothetical protein Z959_08235 [Clostridium novyi B str. ATCC 27606]|uniref:Uncharacterized protein n=1 Tax=Clostridium novyi B str. ATCC 27606 TaxID=1443123 RepID=A0AA40M3C1_CLONO|nr:hypothetical protein [Clostridium novyi]KEI16966.1 hypothetical protein Z959_08235 [Clostridium novyi B str. ATCC 27606]
MKKLKTFIYFILNGESKKYKDLKRYKEKIENEDIDCVIEKMALDYFKMNIEEKYLFELKLKDIINEVDKIPFLSLMLIFIPHILKSTLTGFPIAVLVSLYLIIYILMGRIIIKSVDLYRCCKLYLEVIFKIQENKITEIETSVKRIKYVE